LDGTVGNNGEDEIVELLTLGKVAVSLIALSGTALLCSGQEGCTTGTENDEVWAVNLPWKTLLQLVEEASPLFQGFVILISAHSGGGQPGWYVKCATALGTSEDECLATTGEEVSAEAKNVTGGVEETFAESFTLLVGNKLAKCSASSEAESGVVTGSGLDTSLEGALTVSSTG
jgi:hypothetical protein